MVEAPRNLSGPPGQLNAGNDKEKVNADKFRDLMKIEESDAEQQKKKKQQAEEEEDLKVEELLSQGTQKKELSPTDLARLSKGYKVHEATDSDKKGAHKENKEAEESRSAASIALEVAATAQAAPTEKIEGVNLEPSKTEALPPPSQTEVVLQEMETAIEEANVAEEKIEEEAPPSPPPEVKKEEKPETPSAAAPPPAPPPEVTPMFLSETAPPSPATSLSPELLQLFERIDSITRTMYETGSNETTITLGSAEFSNSVFAGAKVIIRETAGEFNVEFQGNAANTALFSKNVSGLMKAFEAGKNKYKVHIVQTSLLKEERAEFSRKENVGDEDKDTL